MIYHEGPHAEWLTQLFALADWSRHPEEVVWMGKRGGCGLRFAGTLCVSSPMRVPRATKGVLWAVPMYSMALTALAQQCQSLSTVVWVPVQHESCFTCPFVGSGGTLPAIPHSTERPFRNSICMGGDGVEGESGEDCLNCFPNKNLLLLSVVNIDLTYFCYNSI